jgi:predicted acyl esterase
MDDCPSVPSCSSTSAANATGETDVITGAAGGVGTALIQLARIRGARVVAIAGAAKEERLRALGADERRRRHVGPQLLSKPGETSTVEVDLWSTSLLLKKGHRIRVQVTSSCFPRWDRNPNTAEGLKTGDMRVANQIIHLGGGTQSFLPLPIVPAS